MMRMAVVSAALLWVGVFAVPASAQPNAAAEDEYFRIVSLPIPEDIEERHSGQVQLVDDRASSTRCFVRPLTTTAAPSRASVTAIASPIPAVDPAHQRPLPPEFQVHGRL